MQPKYDLHVQLSPKLHEGRMSHYWTITQTTSDGTFVVRDGWAEDINHAMQYATIQIIKLNLN